jgi:ribosome-binding protein aMBF1 (putative translation factor)
MTQKEKENVTGFLCCSCFCRTAGKRVEMEERVLLESIHPEEIRRVRKDVLGWTQKKLDYKLKLPTNHTNRVENGHELPTLELFNFIKGIMEEE